jgi:hypothetical protein
MKVISALGHCIRASTWSKNITHTFVGAGVRWRSKKFFEF